MLDRVLWLFPSTVSRFSRRSLALLVAAAFHITTATAIFFAGKFVDLARVFPDSAYYGKQITVVADVLRKLGIGAWFFGLWPLHVKLYSLSFVVFGPLFNFSVLSLEPLNALCYVLILYLMFSLTRRIFDERTALIATLIVAVWPSFLLFTTGPSKEPLFLCLALLFLTINSFWLKREYSLKRSLMISGLGIITAPFLWLVRSDMWQVMIAIPAVVFVALLITLFKGAKSYRGNLAGVVLLLAVTIVIPNIAVHFYQPAVRWAQNRGVASIYTKESIDRALQQMPIANSPKFFLAASIANVRRRFITLYPAAGSHIDRNVEFNTTADIIRYLPRAAVIGLFSPFPNMWFTPGVQHGRLVRMMVGIETFVLYLIELMAVVGLWHKRREPLVWWLVTVAMIGSLALALAVPNIGALYRLRYFFVMQLVIVASYGFRQTLLSLWRNKQTSTATAIE